ncbi:MAG TPA: IclR family transcriptional regulator [Alphaproteobacteria bacterium]
MKTVRTALALLKQFTHAAPERGVAELSRALGLDKASVHRQLKALEAEGFVEQGRDRRYRLGFAALRLASVRLAQTTLVDVARPHVLELWRRTGETVQLSTLDGDGVLYLHILESPQPIRVASRVGEVGPLHCTAAGKVLLAHLPAPRRAALLARPLAALTPRTVTDPARLERELATVRARGYALDNEGFIAFLRVAAAPVRDSSGAVVAALAVGGPSIRITPAVLRRLAGQVVAAADAIARELGYAGGVSAPPAPAGTAARDSSGNGRAARQRASSRRTSAT